MRHCLGVAIGILGVSYLFFPEENWVTAISIMITLILIWLVERS